MLDIILPYSDILYLCIFHQFSRW